jgi:hypothetical protein
MDESLFVVCPPDTRSGDEPPLMCELFATLSAQLTDSQRGELEVIRQEVLKLRVWAHHTEGEPR